MFLISYHKSDLCINDFIILLQSKCHCRNDEILRHFVGIILIIILTSWLITIFSSSKKIPPAKKKTRAIYDDKETERLQNRFLLLLVGEDEILPPA